MLDMMLSNHPSGFSIGEVNALFRPYRPHHFDPACGCGDEDCNIWAEVRECGEKNLYRTIFDKFPNVQFVVDSSKHPHWIQNQTIWANNQGYDVYHIVLWKEPSAFAHSVHKRHERGWRRQWINYYQQYAATLGMIQGIAKVTVLSYSRLAGNPEECLEKLCYWLDITKTENQKDFWIKKHHTLFGNDSAKVHLKESNGVKSDLAEQEIPRNNHRRIYSEPNIAEFLPAPLATAIENDGEIQRARSALVSAEKGNIEALAAISWSYARQQLSSLMYVIRWLLGMVFGRFIRVQ